MSEVERSNIPQQLLNKMDFDYWCEVCYKEYDSPEDCEDTCEKPVVNERFYKDDLENFFKLQKEKEDSKREFINWVFLKYKLSYANEMHEMLKEKGLIPMHLD